MPPPGNTSNTSNEHAHSTTASRLARAHGIVVRQIADLLAMLPNYSGLASLSESLDVTPEDITNLQVGQTVTKNESFEIHVTESPKSHKFCRSEILIKD